MRRTILGVLALVLLLAALAMAAGFGNHGQAGALQAACLRCGLLAAVAWLAYRDIQRLPLWLLPLLLASFVVVAWRPRLLPLVLLILTALAVLRPRRAKQ